LPRLFTRLGLSGQGKFSILFLFISGVFSLRKLAGNGDDLDTLSLPPLRIRHSAAPPPKPPPPSSLRRYPLPYCLSPSCSGLLLRSTRPKVLRFSLNLPPNGPLTPCPPTFFDRFFLNPRFICGRLAFSHLFSTNLFFSSSSVVVFYPNFVQSFFFSAIASSRD